MIVRDYKTFLKIYEKAGDRQKLILCYMLLTACVIKLAEFHDKSLMFLDLYPVRDLYFCLDDNVKNTNALISSGFEIKLLCELVGPLSEKEFSSPNFISYKRIADLSICSVGESAYQYIDHFAHAIHGRCCFCDYFSIAMMGQFLVNRIDIRMGKSLRFLLEKLMSRDIDKRVKYSRDLLNLISDARAVDLKYTINYS